EVHSTTARLHVAAGDLGAVLAPDHAAQRVQRGMRPHEGVPPRPVEVGHQAVASSGRPTSGRLQLVDDVAAGLARRTDRPAPAVGRPPQQAAIGRLAAAARVEDRPVENDQGRRAALVDGLDVRLDRPRVGIRVAELAADVHAPGPLAYWTVSVPFIVVGWTTQKYV